MPWVRSASPRRASLGGVAGDPVVRADFGFLAYIAHFAGDPS
jgi:hypothetical protein